MTESTPKLITTQEFNEKVRGWTVSVRSRMARNAPKYTGVEWKKRVDPKLAASLSHRIRKDPENISSIIKYQFPRHGVFLLIAPQGIEIIFETS